MSNDDIFNLEGVPSSIKSQLSKTKHRTSKHIYILDFFKLKPQLTIDEIIVACYRVHGKKFKRTLMQSTLYNFVCKNIIAKNSENKYELVKQG